jgi:thiol-disulfide isomerase/thioredoxin
MKNIIFLFVFITASFLSCKPSTKTIVSGTVLNAANLDIVLEETMMKTTMTKTKGKIDANGKFSLVVEDGLKAGIYRLRIGEKQMNLVLDGTERNIGLETDLAQLKYVEYKVTGSKDSELYTKTFQSYFDKKRGIDIAMKSLEESFNKKEITEVEAKKQADAIAKSMNEVLTEIKQVIDKAPNPLVSMLLSLQIEEFMNKDFIELHKTNVAKIEKVFPGTPYSSDYRALLAEISNPKPQEAAPAGKAVVGAQAPPISQSSPDGKTYSLQDVKGKVVLLDFWASWCGPCRKANPSVVMAYNKYHNQGFEVFSVSLDKNAEAWKQAIDQDRLTWKYHVSDLQYWNNAAAAIYGVHSIPQQYLIGRDGKIIAASTPGGNLDLEIEKAMKEKNN